MKRITIEKGDHATFVRETLTDGSFVYNVNVGINTDLEEKDIELEFQCKDEGSAQKLFNTIEESCVGVSEC